MRLLIVEDDPDVRAIFNDFLRELGHQTQLVQSAEAALIVLRNAPPDLILLDIRLPGMSGIDFLQHRAVRESRVPIIAISGLATEPEARRCLRLGVLDFLAKPVSLERLAAVLECFEPYVLTRQAEVAGRPAERRRWPRARIALPVGVLEYSGRQWLGTSVDLSVRSIKVHPEREIGEPAPAARLSFLPPGDGAQLTITSVLVRVDLGGCVFYFANLAAAQLGRLQQLVWQVTGSTQRP